MPLIPLNCSHGLFSDTGEVLRSTVCLFFVDLNKVMCAVDYHRPVGIFRPVCQLLHSTANVSCMSSLNSHDTRVTATSRHE